MSNKSIGISTRSNVRSFGAHLYLHDLLLLHEEVADASQNDALKELKLNSFAFAQRIRKDRCEKHENKSVRRFIHTFTYTRIFYIISFNTDLCVQ